MTGPRRVSDVPEFPFPDDPRVTPQRSGDWFGPVMIGLAVLVVLAVGFGMVLAVFPDLLADEDEASAVETELRSALEDGFATESWYEMILGLNVEGDVIVVQTSAEDGDAEGLEPLCEAVLEVASAPVDEPAVSVVSEADEEIYACP